MDLLLLEIVTQTLVCNKTLQYKIVRAHRTERRHGNQLVRFPTPVQLLHVNDVGH